MKKTIYIIWALVICLSIPAANCLSQNEWLEDIDIVIGEVTDVDLARSTVTVADEDGRLIEAVVDKELTTVSKGGEFVELSEVKKGETVELEYHKEEGVFIADWIELLEYMDAADLPPELKLDEPADYIFEEEDIRTSEEAVERVD